MAKEKVILFAKEPLFDSRGQRTHERYVTLFSENDEHYFVEDGNERGGLNSWFFDFSPEGLEKAVMHFDSVNIFEVKMDDWDKLEDERDMWKKNTVQE